MKYIIIVVIVIDLFKLIIFYKLLQVTFYYSSSRPRTFNLLDINLHFPSHLT